MKPGCSIISFLVAVLHGAALAGGACGAEPVSATAAVAAEAPQLPPLATLRSPLKFFRDLLVMSAAERNQQLAARPPQSRQVILEKLREYEALPADERELRLRTTELSWYLRQLFPLTASQRAVLLTNAAPLDRELVKARLAYWDKIPPEQQKLLLESKAALEYLAGIRRGGGASSSTSSPDMAEDLGRFRNLSPGERVKVMEQFKQLFELEDNERATVLHRRSGPKREQLERALIQLRQIPSEKQAAYVDAVSRFTVMTEAEQAQFLKSAERWKQLSTEERAAWQALFIQSPALLEPPPLPPGFDPYAPPPLPPTLAPNKTPMQATNRPPRNNIGA